MTDSLSQLVNGICEKNIMEIYGRNISLYDRNFRCTFVYCNIMLHRPSSLKDISSPISQFNAHMPLSLIIEKGHINAGTKFKNWSTQILISESEI